MIKVNITKHAKKRMKERCGLNEKSSDRLAERAYDNGLKHSDLNGNLKKWVDGLYLKYQTGNQIRLYGDKAFIFHNAILITVIQIPSNLVKEKIKIENKRNQIIMSEN